MKSCFSYKDPISNNLKSFLVYRFSCASYKSNYINKTCHLFKTRITEHIKKDNKSHVFKHLHFNGALFEQHNCLSFKITQKTYLNST